MGKPVASDIPYTRQHEEDPSQLHSIPTLLTTASSPSTVHGKTFECPVPQRIPGVTVS